MNDSPMLVASLFPQTIEPCFTVDTIQLGRYASLCQYLPFELRMTKKLEYKTQKLSVLCNCVKSHRIVYIN